MPTLQVKLTDDQIGAIRAEAGKRGLTQQALVAQWAESLPGNTLQRNDEQWKKEIEDRLAALESPFRPAPKQVESPVKRAMKAQGVWP